MDVKPLGKCFVSHAYKDAAARDRLVAGPLDREGVQPFIFPPIEAPPDQFVSNPLVAALLDCDCLIFLNGGFSETSFWVAFERDYALRVGKQVFSADPKTMEITQHLGNALDLATFASYHPRDAPQVCEIAEFLKGERFFDLWLDVDDLPAGVLWEQEIKDSIEDRLQRGGYLVVFWSREASQSEWVSKEIQSAAKEISEFNDRVLFACLDEAPLPDFWLRFHEPMVQLYGDEKRLAKHRVDDLVVRLYWLIYRKTKYRDLDGG